MKVLQRRDVLSVKLSAYIHLTSPCTYWVIMYYYYYMEKTDRVFCFNFSEPLQKRVFLLQQLKWVHLSCRKKKWNQHQQARHDRLITASPAEGKDSTSCSCCSLRRRRSVRFVLSKVSNFCRRRSFCRASNESEPVIRFSWGRKQTDGKQCSLISSYGSVV